MAPRQCVWGALMALQALTALAVHAMVASSRTRAKQHANPAHPDGLVMQGCAASALQDPSLRRDD